MNCPSRAEPVTPVGWNQNPGELDLAVNHDFNGRANRRQQRDHRIPQNEAIDEPLAPEREIFQSDAEGKDHHSEPGTVVDNLKNYSLAIRPVAGSEQHGFSGTDDGQAQSLRRFWRRSAKAGLKYARFMGPGLMISVAYIDPGNYATDVAAGASYRFQLLVMVLLSNFVAIYFQSLSVKLGTVTGLDLAENIKRNCPKWLNYTLYFMAQSAIIATDMAEVIGTAIALDLLSNGRIPLVAGCAISIVDVLIILLFYNPSGSLRGIRIFELGVGLLVMGVVICFCVELSLISVPDVGEIFRGFLPSSVLIQGQGLYQACGIMGATVMPHSLYLGSGLVKPRLREYDETHGNVAPRTPRSSHTKESDEVPESIYKPSLAAIKSCMNYSIAELTISLATFALFVNSAILIVAGASLSNTASANNGDLFGIHDLLSQTLSRAAGVIFALALLFSGTSAGIVCTMAGQMVCEGQLTWRTTPWVRQMITRSISVTPSIIIAGACGREKLSQALEGSQVALSAILPFVTAPLIYFTCRNKFMTVLGSGGQEETVKMRNSWLVTGIGIVLWLVIAIMNIASWVLMAVQP